MEDRTAVLESTAMVAGWAPMGNAQISYVEQSTRRAVVATRLILGDMERLPANPVEPVLTDIEAFHDVQLAPSRWNREVVYQKFVDELQEHVAIMEGFDSEHACAILCRVRQRVFWSFAKARPTLMRRIAADVERRRAAGENTTKFAIGRAKSRQFIINALNADYSQYENLMEELKGYILRPGEERLRPVVVRRTEPVAEENTEADRGRYASGARKRVPWTEHETAVLVAGVRRRSSWADIALELPGRTNVDCKDRWRNIKKHYE